MSRRQQENDSPHRLVYSTNPDLRAAPAPDNSSSPHPASSELRVLTDSRHRNGKTVTLVRGFAGSPPALEELSRLLKRKCGVGGSVKDNDIIIQGDFKDKIITILRDNGYRAR